jgi:hypothetical protein
MIQLPNRITAIDYIWNEESGEFLFGPVVHCNTYFPRSSNISFIGFLKTVLQIIDQYIYVCDLNLGYFLKYNELYLDIMYR